MPKVFDLIRPLDERDTYAITDVIYQKGGLREVENIQERDAITIERRSYGMIAFISSTSEFYALTGVDLTNNSWEKIDFSKNLQNELNIKELSIQGNSFSVSEKQGENLSISVTNSSILKIKEGNSVISLTDENKTDGKLLFVQNVSTQEIKIKNNYFKYLTENNISLDDLEIPNDSYPILTGLNRDTSLLSGASMLLQFSTFDMTWRVIGSLSVDPTFLQLLDTPDQYPQVEKNNNMFLLVNPDNTKQDKVIFDNPFPIVSNSDNNLVIKNINGLRIRKFDNEKGEIIFAKFEPTLSLILNKLINFDDEIKSVTVNVVNDSFVENIKVNKIISLKYYKNNNDKELFNINTIPTLPSEEYISHSWNQILNFDVISDINPFFKDLKTPFVLEVTLKDTEGKEYSIKNDITQTSPDFNFTIENRIADFRDSITQCSLKLTYTNISNKNLNSQITSINSNSFNSPTYKNLTKGIDSYLFDYLSINADHVVKSENLTDSGNFIFTTICRFTRPITIDSNQNYFEITKNANLNVTFVYPIFIGITDTFKTILTKSDIINLFSNEGNSILPRKFNYIVGNINKHWWFCVRKRYVNNKKISFILTSGGFTLSTNVIYSNEVEIPNFNGTNETYVCYCIILQANNSYSINVVFE